MSREPTTPTAGPHVGDVVAGKYKLQRALGEGGMGRVFLARHEITGRPVALKIVATSDPMTRRRLLVEARAMGRLSHPNVVGVLDMGEWERAVFLVMEYVHGKALSELMKGKSFDPERALQLLLPACSGVAAAHQAGILHRDLKPENLFVCTDRDGEPITTKVLDFGVAKALDEAEGLVTDSGIIVGTPRYMAPEQIAKEGILDERTDIYALGLILYELLVGRLPYATGSLRSVMLEILKGDFAAPHHLEPRIPTGLSDAVLKALELRSDDRPPTVEAFARALEPFSGGRRFEAPLDVHTHAGAPDSDVPEPGLPDRGPEDTTARPREAARGAGASEAPLATTVDGDVAITDTLPSTDRPGKGRDAGDKPPGTTPGGTELEERSGGMPPRALWVALGALVFGAATWWAFAPEREASPSPEGVSSPLVASSSKSASPPAPSIEPDPAAAISAVGNAAPEAPQAARETVAEASAPRKITTPAREPPPTKPPVRRRSSKRPKPAGSVLRAPAPFAPAPPPGPEYPKTDNRNPWAEAL